MRASAFASRLRRRRRVSVEVLEDRQLLATITVNTAADPATPGTTMSLREAIEVSNGTLSVSSLSTQQQAQVSGAVGNTNTIDFNIPTTDSGYNAATGVWTITPHEDLPAISTNAAIIDGYSQPGASKNTLAQGDNAKLVIAISGNSIGLTIGQEGSQVLGLDVENFGYAGIVVTAGGNVQVAGCFIGTDPSGETTAPSGNGGGVVLENSSNLIGGPNVGDRNVISGNGDGAGASYDAGVFVPDKSNNPLNITPTGNVIENNIIGLDAAGTKSIPNALGVNDGGSGDIYGGTAPGLGNVISGNNTNGINFTGSITIEGNYVGTNAAGNAVGGHGQAGGIFGVEHSGTPNPSTISGNVVSGNEDNGIFISVSVGNPASFTIADNLIGTDASGTKALGNGGYGLSLLGVENDTVQDNVISGNGSGVSLGNGTSTGQLQHLVFQGNLIGTDNTGLQPLGNAGDGIDVSGSGITIGGAGTGQGNVIAYNSDEGINIFAGQQDQIIRNSIFGNRFAGIAVAHSGNQFAAAPVLKFTPGSGGNGTLSGTLTETPNTAYVVEVFSNPSAPAPGDEQGKTFVQDLTVNTDGSGKGTFSVNEPDTYYTVTARDPNGNTSAFSNAAGVATLNTSVTSVVSSANPSTFGQQVTFTATVSAGSYSGTPTGTVTFIIDGQDQTPVTLALVGGSDQAQFTTSSLSAGSHTVTASYSGDENVSSSTASLPTQTVTGSVRSPLATATTLTSSLDPSKAGLPVTFTADVTAPTYQGTPTGTVTFIIDGQAQTPVPLAMVGSSDEAQFTSSTLAAGTHTVTASYSGDTKVSSSAGSLPTQTVTAPVRGLLATTTTLTSSLDPSTVGQPVTFTAVVSPGAAAGTPTGTVTFTIDGKAEAPVPLTHDKSGAAHASFQISTLSAGKHTVTASYSGDSTDAASSLVTPLLQTVIASTVGAPRVTLVQRFGVHMHPTVRVLSFDAALDPASATSLQNYALVGPEGNHIGFKSVSYDSSAHTVTLRPTVKINVHRTYRLTVIGNDSHGVCGVDRALLDGAGQPGTDFVTSVTWKNAVITPEQARILDEWLDQEFGGRR
jgi:Bacterial Ig-like domain (group 3)/Periplasmic copper-binding protein (NosD)